MQFKAFAVFSCFALANAQSLTDAIANNSDLSQLGTLLQSQPNLASQLAGASNITVLAPNNAAIGAFLNSSQAQSLNSSSGVISAL